MTSIRSASWMVAVCVSATVLVDAVVAQPQQPNDSPSSSSTSAEQLVEGQRGVAQKYQQLELLMLKMAEFDASTNPRRSALIRQALSRSKDRQVYQQLAELAALLGKNQLKKASQGQTDVQKDLAAILELLLSENRADRLKEEQDRVRRYIKEVERVLRQQRSVQGRTEGGDEPERLAKDQRNVADRTQRLAQEIKENESSANGEQQQDGQQQDGQQQDGQQQDGQQQDGQQQDGKQQDGKQQDGQQQDGQQQDGQQQDGQQQDGQQQDGQQQDGQHQDGQQQDGQQQGGQQQGGQQQGGQQQGGQQQGGQQQGGQQQDGEQPTEQPRPQSFPGQQQISEAEQRMRDAERKLEEANRNDALEDQEKARELLEQAKAQLEEILRQMREEEIERTLAMLESRFRRMLEMQISVYEDTQQLAEIPAAERGGSVIVQSGKLSVRERNILAEADKALLLLHEEGSSVAFPEAVQQMRSDIEQIVERLGKAKIDPLTTGLEEDVIAALEEIVEALQKAQQDAEQRRQRQQQRSGQMSPQDMPLVDAIAELKMIRALQMRVNRRTDTYAKMLAEPDSDVGQATDVDLLESLRALAEREARIRQITRDIILEKNR